MIGGNIQIALQTKITAKNSIGEAVKTWATIQTLTGWLDYQSGESRRENYDAKIAETTHIFIGDYVSINANITADCCRAVVSGENYDVLLIDNPMSKNRQIEIYLKYTGGQVDG